MLQSVSVTGEVSAETRGWAEGLDEIIEAVKVRVRSRQGGRQGLTAAVVQVSTVQVTSEYSDDDGKQKDTVERDRREKQLLQLRVFNGINLWSGKVLAHIDAKEREEKRAVPDTQNTVRRDGSRWAHPVPAR